MASKFAEKVIAAAKAETALHLTAKETHQLATELGQMSRLIIKLIHGEMQYAITPEILAGMVTDTLFAGLASGGFSLSTDGKQWWLAANLTGNVQMADSLLHVVELVRSDQSLGPIPSASLVLDGADLYKRLEELNV